jgi:hypothetical protein
MKPLSPEARAIRAQLKAAIRELEKPEREARRAERKAARGARPKREKRIDHVRKVIRDRDAGYLSWLHGLPCIACMILGPAPAAHAHIEAAHQKAQDADRGWNKRAGVRPHDRQSAPLCEWHHRTGPIRCDPAQAKFWALLGVDVIDYCQRLYAAYLAGEDALPIIEETRAKVSHHGSE